MKYLKYLVPVIIGIFVPTSFYFYKIDYIEQDGEPMAIEELSEAVLQENENNYVEFFRVCSGTSTYYEEVNKSKIEVWSIVECDSVKNERVLVFANFNKKSKYQGLGLGAVDGEPNYWSGKLVKGMKNSGMLTRMMKRDGVDFSDEQVWTLLIGDLPSVDKKVLFNLKILCPIAGVLILILLIFTDFKSKREEKRKEEIKKMNEEEQFFKRRIKN